MEIITLTCKVISPMFSGNANNKEAELRSSAFIGSLRFWWRAIHPNLSLQELIKKEKEFFGGRDDDKTHYLPYFRFIEIDYKDDIIDEFIDARPTKVNNYGRRVKSKCIEPNATFTIKLQIIKEKEKVLALFKLASALGGIGKRSRRGAGAWKIENIYKDTDITYDKKSINAWITTINENYASITLNTNKLDYPYLKDFSIGDETYVDSEALRKKIMETASSCKHSNQRLFKQCLGKAENNDRLASPIYVSMIEYNIGVKPIISKLNFKIPFDRNRSVKQNKVDKEDMLILQNKFINCIINNSDC